jgi:large subunit ribosomal protein L4
MVDLKTIDFSNNQIGSFNFDCSNISVESPESIASTVNWQLSKRRSGSAKVKSMSEISGTTAKPHKQKGTGHARQGSKRSVQFRGGRTCFGPTPRSFGYSLPKKVVKKAISNALKIKIQENKVILYSGFKDLMKTTDLNKLLNSAKVNQALLVCDSTNMTNLSKSARNIKNVKVLDFQGLNVYDVLNFDFLLLDQNLFKNIKEVVL